MFKKTCFFFLLILASILIVSFLVQQNRNHPPSIIRQLSLEDRIPFEETRLLFKVNFLGFLPVGYAKIENKGGLLFKGRQALHLSAEAIALKLISSFYDVLAGVDSYVDKENLHSLKFSENLIIPGKPQERKEVFYDQKNNIMELEGIRRKILPDTQDPLSAIFYIRRQSLEIGKEFDININTNQKNYCLLVKVIKKNEYQIKDKGVGVWILQGEIRRRDENPRHSSSLTMWLLDNPYKTPLLIKVSASAFLVTLRLIDLK